MVVKLALTRVSSLTCPDLSIGTLKSTRTKTLFPLTSIESKYFMRSTSLEYFELPFRREIRAAQNASCGFCGRNDKDIVDQ